MGTGAWAAGHNTAAAAAVLAVAATAAAPPIRGGAAAVPVVVVAAGVVVGAAAAGGAADQRRRRIAAHQQLARPVVRTCMAIATVGSSSSNNNNHSTPPLVEAARVPVAAPTRCPAWRRDRLWDPLAAPALPQGRRQGRSTRGHPRTCAFLLSSMPRALPCHAREDGRGLWWPGILSCLCGCGVQSREAGLLRRNSDVSARVLAFRLLAECERLNHSRLSHVYLLAAGTLLHNHRHHTTTTTTASATTPPPPPPSIHPSIHLPGSAEAAAVSDPQRSPGRRTLNTKAGLQQRRLGGFGNARSGTD